MTEEDPVRPKDEFLPDGSGDDVVETLDIRTLEVDHTTSTAHRLLHYDGVCNNIHGHNMRWEVELGIEVPDDETNMAVDFKDVSGLLDQYDHAILLNEDDPLLEWIGDGNAGRFGTFYTFDGDPTCELVAEVVADEFVELENVRYAQVTLSETDKYSMTAKSYEI